MRAASVHALTIVGLTTHATLDSAIAIGDHSAVVLGRSAEVGPSGPLISLGTLEP